MPAITPFLWFDQNAEEAVNFYVAVFPNSKILAVTRVPEGGPGPAGAVMTMSFELDGKPFTALNGGPHFKFTEAVSFVVHCNGQTEIDYYWERLLNGGQEQACGWLKDRFGLSWQIVPSNIGELFSGGDGARTQRVMAAMMPMKKLDVAKLKQAYDG
jgi:predicted 3-demethylubiquinone-9 3-methyltransferase (glyoxalase superfamily)